MLLYVVSSLISIFMLPLQLRKEINTYYHDRYIPLSSLRSQYSHEMQSGSKYI